MLVAECCYFPDDSFAFSHFMYMMKFVGCETLNLVNVLGQMYFMDRFMNMYYTYIYILPMINLDTFVDICWCVLRNGILQTFICRFLGGEFSTYGLKVHSIVLNYVLSFIVHYI